MSSTWVVGDIHGCAQELQQLLDRIELQAGDRLISAGDLFHRGPDPVRVLRLLEGLGNAFQMVLGNHERALLKRFGFASKKADGSGVTPIELPAIRRIDEMRGDNQAILDPSALGAAEEILRFLCGRGFVQRGSCLGPAWEGESREWLVVHGSVLPGRTAEQMKPKQLVRLSRCLDREGSPLWYEAWQGPEFVVFGHAQSAAGEHRASDGRLMAWGLDRGCVYGGTLSALRLEDLATVDIPAGG